MKSSFLIVLALSMIIFNAYSFSNPKIDSLKQNLLKDNINDSIRLVTYNSIAKLYAYNNSDSTTKYANNALKLVSKKFQDKELADPLSYLVLANYIAGDYPKAIEYCYKLMDLGTQLKDTLILASAFGNLGMAQGALKEDSLCLLNYKQAFAYYQKLGNKRKLAIMAINLGAVNTRLGRYQESMRYYQKSLDISIEIEFHQIIGGSYANMADVYEQIENLDSATYYYNQAIPILESIQDYYSLAHVYLGLANCFKEKDSSSQAKNYTNLALEYAQKVSSKGLVEKAYRSYSEIYTKRKDFYKALFFYKKANLYKDSLFNESKDRDIKNLELQRKKVEYELLKNSHALLEKEQKLQYFELENEKQNKIYGIGIIVGISVSFIMLFYFLRKAKYQNAILLRTKEDVVDKNQLLTTQKLQLEQATKELQEANEEALAQNADIQQKNEEINTQSEKLLEVLDEVKIKNKQVTDSIRYAYTIQKAVLPDEKELLKTFENYGVIYLPKDIVSGDLFWVKKVENYVFFAVIDCTGHGVPGAFMSVVANSLLSKALEVERNFQPDKILEYLHKEFVKELNQTNNKIIDGFDISLCRMPLNENNETEVLFSGANQKMIIYHKNENKLEIVKGTRQGIGGVFGNKKRKQFEVSAMKLKKSDRIFLYTDGIVDQSNIDGNKIGTNNLVELITNSISLPVHAQRKHIEEYVSQYMMNTKQRDDITLLVLEL